MEHLIKLNQKNLQSLSKEADIPSYDRSAVHAGIVHVGVGGFHRAHQAVYTDDLLHHSTSKDWGICGVALLDNDRKIFETLRDQDGLYTLMITAQDGATHARVIGSIVEYLFAPDDPGQVIRKMAGKDTRIITLTITEGGYNFKEATGAFQWETPLIQWDLQHPSRPKTIFGYLTQAIKMRRDQQAGDLTIQSCDNIQGNGDTCKKMLYTYCSKAEPGLTAWMDEHVSFPNSMVDRITPVTVASDIGRLRTAFGIEDKWPVVCEPFRQWVVEDHFRNGRPAWEQYGAQFVQDVQPYEKLKIRLLNGGHVVLGALGFLAGYQYVHEAIGDQVLQKALRKFLDREAAPLLDAVPGINVEEYKETIIQRFGNPNIKDLLTRIISEGSSKYPKFLLPTIAEDLAAGLPIDYGALSVAAWCHYLGQAAESDSPVQDARQEELKKAAYRAMHHDPKAFLEIDSIFGDLVHAEPFVAVYTSSLAGIANNGILETVKKGLS